MATTSVGSTTSTSANTTTSQSAASTSTNAPIKTDAQIAAANKAAAQSLVSSLGAGSGVDVNSLAQNLVNAEKVPQQNAINAKINKNESRISGLSAISYVVSQVQTAFAALKDQSSFNTLTASNTNTAAVDITASTSANVGAHTIAIAQLAHAQRSVSAGLATASMSLNNGQALNLSLAVGSATPISIAVAPGSDTPQGVVDAINASTGAKASGVTAQLVNTGDGSGNPFKIVLSGALGAANSFTLTGLGNAPNPVATPTIATTQGAPTVNDASAVTFSDLLAGQSVTVAGMTYTATADTSAAQLASAFAGLNDGTTKAGAAVNDPGTGSLLGSLSGVLSGYNAGPSASGSVLSFSSTSGVPNGDSISVVAADVSSGVAPTLPTVQSTRGTAGSRETSVVTFQALSTGQSVTVAGVTYTASVASTAADVAAAFSNLHIGGALPTGLAKGTLSGSLAGFNAGANTPGSASLTFTSAAANTNVTDIAVSSAKAAFFYAQDPSNQTASDAQLNVDGISYTRSTNSVTDVVTGVTLALKDTTPSGIPATVNLTRDTSAITTNVNSLVSAYNDAMSMLNVVSDPKSTVATYGATLVGDSIVQMVKQQLRAMFTKTSSTPGTAVSAMWQMGLSVDQTGTLSVDSTKLDAALTNNYSDVVKTFTGNQNKLSTYSTTPAGIAGDAYKKLDKLLSASGPMLSQSQNATTQNTKYQTQLTALNTRMDSLLARYQKQFAAMDSLVGSVNSKKTSLKATFDGMMATYTGKTG